MWVDSNTYLADRSSPLASSKSREASTAHPAETSTAHPAVASLERVVLGETVPPSCVVKVRRCTRPAPPPTQPDPSLAPARPAPSAHEARPPARQGQRRGSPFGQRRPSNGQQSPVGRRSSRVQDAKDFLKHRTHAVAPITEITTVEALSAPPPAPVPWSQMLADGNSAKAVLDAIQELQQEPAALREHSERLAELLHDEAWFVRRAAIGAVTRLELAPPQALELLLPSLDDEHAEVRARGLAALTHLGPRARAAGERQAEARAAAAAARRLCDVSPAVRAAAAACLGSLEATELEGKLAQALAPLLSDVSGAVRAEVAAALGGLSAAARRPYLASIEALARSDALGEVRAAARRALQGTEAGGERERDCATTLLPASCSTLLPLTSCSLSRVHVIVRSGGAGDLAGDGGDTERVPLVAQAQLPPGEQGQRERAGVLVTSFGSSVGCATHPS